MEEHESLAARFEENRSHLRAVAYRMLGSPGEADDALQEAWLRLDRSDTSRVKNLSGWLTTVVARVCLDMLRSRESRREAGENEPIGTYVPDLIVSRDDGFDPEHEALLADSIGLAASRSGDFDALLAVLHSEVVLRADRGATVTGASREVRGAPAVAEQALTFSRFAEFARPALVNGAAGVVVAPRGMPYSVMGFTVTRGKIVGIYILADPERLRRLDLAVLDE